jgi:two-component system sensor histidine kinase DesK
VIIAAASGFAHEIIFAPIITASVAISLLATSRQVVSNRRLRMANTEIARLAVQDERARFSRDLHDILGHSLTVVTVKSELAGRLVEIDPKRAIAEIKDIEDLARQALSDLRSAVSSYREVNLASELASALTALAAASIEAHVPLDAESVDPDLRAVFGWVVREGVTNVIRHSRAHSCWVELGHDTLVIRDDGVGEGSPAIGNGLRGLGERAHADGLVFAAATRPHGGFQVSVGRAKVSVGRAALT